MLLQAGSMRKAGQAAGTGQARVTAPTAPAAGIAFYVERLTLLYI